MGHPSFQEVVQRLRQVAEDLDRVAGRAEQWPSHLHETLCEEVAAIAEHLQMLATQIERRPEGDQLAPARLFADDAYTTVATMPFPGTSVHLVSPNRGHWAESERLLSRSADPEESLELVAYLDTDDSVLIDRALDALEGVADVLGYSDFEVVEEARGSIFRRALSRLKSGVQSDEMSLRLAQVERAIHLGAIDTKQAQVDEMTARAVESLVSSTAEIPRVAMRAGSILLIKYTEPSGPVVLVRQLSSVELNALERYPGLQKEPESLLENLHQVIQSEAITAPPES